jgi:hypothetical protein
MHPLARLFEWTNAHPIVQSALGSFFFWAVLQAFLFLWPRFLRSVGYAAAIDRRKKYRGYIYRRYASRDGFVDPVIGSHITISHTLRGLLQGLMFVAVALLFGGSVRAVWVICLAGALMFFGSALTWLMPSRAWMGDNMVRHWQRVAELEQELFGEVDEKTKDILAESIGNETRRDSSA